MTRVAALLTVAVPTALLAGAAGAQAMPLAQRPAIAVRDATLSELVNAGGGCEWRRVDPVSGKVELLARFSGVSCEGADVSFSPAHDAAAILFPEGDDGAPPRAWRLDTLTSTLAELAPPPSGALQQLAYDGDGGLVALTLDTAELAVGAESVTRANGWLEFEGHRYDVPPQYPGIATLAHAWRFGDDDEWTLTETAGTTVQACDAPGEKVLDAARTLAPDSLRALLAPDDVGDPVRSAALAAALEPFAPHKEKQVPDGPDWLEREMPASESDTTSIIVAQEMDESAYATTPVLFVDASDRLTPAEGLERGRVIVTPVRGHWLLVTDAFTGARPRLYDLRTRKLVWSSEDAVGVVFWPR